MSLTDKQKLDVLEASLGKHHGSEERAIADFLDDAVHGGGYSPDDLAGLCESISAVALEMRDKFNGVSDDEEEFDVWGEDAEFSRRDWQYQVANGDTNQGYWDWVAHEREVRADEDENRGKRAADVEAAVTTAAREAAWLEMGYSVTDDRIETALQICYGYSDDELTTGLAELTAQLAATGGRSVALAEAIDNRRIALAVRRANAKERQ